MFLGKFLSLPFLLVSLGKIKKKKKVLGFPFSFVLFFTKKKQKKRPKSHQNCKYYNMGKNTFVNTAYAKILKQTCICIVADMGYKYDNSHTNFFIHILKTCFCDSELVFLLFIFFYFFCFVTSCQFFYYLFFYFRARPHCKQRKRGISKNRAYFIYTSSEQGYILHTALLLARNLLRMTVLKKRVTRGLI